jgi:hypothetical protein
MNSDFSNSYIDSAVQSFGAYSQAEVINSSSLYISGFSADSATDFVGRYNFGLTTAIAEPGLAQADIYPNPTSGKIFIGPTGPQETIKVYNTQGLELNCAIRNGEIDLGNLPQGVYFVQISSGNSRTCRRILRE